jgi:hypothetical protein
MQFMLQLLMYICYLASQQSESSAYTATTLGLGLCIQSGQNSMVARGTLRKWYVEKTPAIWILILRLRNHITLT